MPILEHMYPELLLEHFQNPRNVGELPPPAVTVEVANPACGDILRLSVRFAEGRAAGVRDKGGGRRGGRRAARGVEARGGVVRGRGKETPGGGRYSVDGNAWPERTRISAV